MFLMGYDIKIGKYKVAHLLSCEVRKSANQLSDTATITLPGMAYSKALEIESKISRGDEVSIRLGYDGELKKEFDGYVRTIGSDNTISIGCEDSMFLFRKEVKNKQYKKVAVATLVKEVADQIGGFAVEVGTGVSDITFDKFTIQNATAFEVLKKVKEETKLHIFVKGKTLHLHLQYVYNEGSVQFDFSEEVETSNLKYRKKEDKKVQVEMVGINRKNEKVRVFAGEAGGDKFTEHRYNISDKKALKAIGEEELKKHRFTGYEGDITGWLTPYCTYGYGADIKDNYYPEREGRYYVEAVTTSFDGVGKRKITLGKLLK